MTRIGAVVVAAAAAALAGACVCTQVAAQGALPAGIENAACGAARPLREGTDRMEAAAASRDPRVTACG